MPKDLKALMGHNIRRLRQACGLSVPKFAARLGVSRQAVTAWENGRGIGHESIVGIAKEFGLSTDLIYGNLNNPSALQHRLIEDGGFHFDSFHRLDEPIRLPDGGEIRFVPRALAQPGFHGLAIGLVGVTYGDAV